MENIKPSELCIGNWVGWNGPVMKEQARIAGISNSDVVFYCGDYGLPDELFPILLTKEWLVKFNFKPKYGVSSYYYSYDNGKVRLHSKDNKIFMFIFDYEHDDVEIEIKYVHQLQNLVFALTGEELKIN